MKPEVRDDDPLFAAALVEFERYGIRRANVDDIAKRAGVSRSTFYRHFTGKDDILNQLVMRYVDQFFGALQATVTGLGPGEAIIQAFVAGISLVRQVPLFVSILESEPDLMVRMNAVAEGTAIVDISAKVASTLRQAGATLSDERLREVSELLLRIAISFIAFPNGGIDVASDGQARRFAEDYLAPLIDNGGGNHH
ncbi:TetR/AcrR family transcriptional regulator [Smaragdicoccus niigatensis]|uniref:TetR/AcrR family transcriptional regulator n=1 Tax=Smaragdicoccus niigatensis TaxID=359359 RepID=UPI000360C190|nr:TetR/AcrR family transcriptional regulator [Smaragdicoccus niigatensis]